MTDDASFPSATMGADFQISGADPADPLSAMQAVEISGLSILSPSRSEVMRELREELSGLIRESFLQRTPAAKIAERIREVERMYKELKEIEDAERGRERTG